MRNYFDKVIIQHNRPLDASHFDIEFILISLLRAKQMRKIMYNRALFILDKNFNLSHFYIVIENEVFDSHSKDNRFVVMKMLKCLIIVLFTRKLKILVFVLFHLNP